MANTLIGAPVRLTLREFSERENIPLATVRYWINIGYAPTVYKMGRRIFMDLDDVLRWETDLKANAR